MDLIDRWLKAWQNRSAVECRHCGYDLRATLRNESGELQCAECGRIQTGLLGVIRKAKRPKWVPRARQQIDAEAQAGNGAVEDESASF